MTDTNRDGISTSHHDLHAPTGLRYPSKVKPVQKRTRSQLKVPDSTLRLPLSRSPLKDARKAHASARGTSPTSQTDSKLHSPGPSPTERGGIVAAMNVVMKADPQEAVHRVEEEEMDTCADGGVQRYEKEEGSEDSLFGGEDYDENSNSNQSHPTTWPASTKKRASPDTDEIRALSSPGSQRQSKRAKVEAFQLLGRRQEHSEYHEPLRDPDAGTPGRRRGHKRVASMKPTSSPSKASSSIFPPRARSVPPGGGNEVQAVDFTSIPPSPRRSPSKGAVEIRRALSVPPPDEEMDVDADDASVLLQFTNPTHVATPRANPVFQYAVNFATPRRSETLSRSGFPIASPLSPLTPLPPSPPEYPPDMRSVLAKVCSLSVERVSSDHLHSFCLLTP